MRRLSERLRRQAFESAGRPGDFEYTSTTIAVDRARLPEALARIARFRRELLDHLTQGERRDAVVQLEISLLPLTRNPETERTSDGDDR